MVSFKVIIKIIIVNIVHSIQNICNCFFSKKIIIHYKKPVNNNFYNEIMRRLEFFLPDNKAPILLTTNSFQYYFLPYPILTFNVTNNFILKLYSFRSNFYNIDQYHNPKDGWSWFKFTYSQSLEKINLEKSRSIFRKHIENLRVNNFTKAYLFGTGPSLPSAKKHNFNDGFRVVCNTIVKDSDLWKKINPHFIVAADAIYHFGFSSHARAFRNDLKKRLVETNTIFVYPSLFHPIVIREFSELEEKLVPIPFNYKKEANLNIVDSFFLPAVGNILNCILIPLGCTLSKNVYLFGFDGRAPTDKLFWANSSDHSYPEYIDELKISHPAFFSYFVPNDKQDQYVKQVHGDILEKNLQLAEKMGWEFKMMHKTWTPTLQKRIINSF